jgi:uncharacterized protein (DUF302 family)
MTTKSSRITALGIAAGMALALAAGGVALAAPAWGHHTGDPGFVTVRSSHGYAETLSTLEHAIKGNGLMVMGKVNQKAILSMTGLHLAGAESLLVGNPRVGKKLFSMNPAVAAVVPARISAWVSHGATYIGYFAPSALMGAISTKLAKPGHMLDMKFHTIVEQAAH